MKTYTLITGGSSGIGLELAKIATKEGRNVLLVARDKSALKQTALELSGSGVEVDYFAIDLSQIDSAAKVYEYCKKNQILVSELVNNAGFGDYGNFSDSKLQTQLSMIDLNIRSLTELTHLFLPAMIANNNAKILNLGSVASFLPGPLMSVYFASKNYVLSFSRALSEELRGTGITVTCLCPGATSTGFGKAAHVSDTHSTAHPKTTAQEVAVFGWYHMQNGTRVAIHGRGNRISIWLTKFVPRDTLARIVKKIQR